MARNICTLLANRETVGKFDFKDVPLGDIFRDASFGFDEYELFGTKNRFYSSEYLKRLADIVK